MIPFRFLAGLAAIFAAAPLVAAPAAAQNPTPASTPEAAPATLPAAASLVRVNSTNQAFSFLKPWSKDPPFPRRGIGVVLPGGRVLVTAELVANHSYVELERPARSEKVPATVERVDYKSNLALLRPQAPGFLDGALPVALAASARVGTRLTVVQLESTGSIALTPAVVTTITVAGYPADGIALLAYKLSAPLQYRDHSFTMPVFAGDRLAGLLMRYDVRSQTAEVVPSAVIANFIARADREPYVGFPRAGVALAPTRDPQFRRYLKMRPEQTGVYVVSVVPGSTAERAGLKKGDVVLRADGHAIDEDGNYAHPEYGKIPFSYLISTANLPGSRIPLRVLRGGEELDLDLPLEPRDPATIISETAILDRAPRYFILGGLVFQELSRSYLRQWGNDWRSNAPPRLVYLDEFQDELPPGRGKIVFLSQVLPTDTTLGYEEVESTVVEKINGITIRRLEDVARAAENPVDGFHRIDLESDPGVLYLDAKDVAAGRDELKSSYGLPTLENLVPPIPAP